MNRGLYLHIPFCEHLCSYCDFAKVFYNQSLVDAYLEELKKDLASIDKSQIASIYIGGGTPTSLNLAQEEKLLQMLLPFVHDDISYTIECNVENLTEDKIALFAQYGINRISLGVQSFNPRILHLMGRKHTFEQVKHLIDLLHFYHLDDISCDLIYGNPSQSLDELQEDLTLLTSLDITHISTYALSVNQHTLLYLQHYQEASQDDLASQYELIIKMLHQHGFERYEVSNFAKNNYQSQHNLLYWHNQEYYGIGVGASSYLDHIRSDNTKSLNKYLLGERIIYQEQVTKDNEVFYYYMLGLRLVTGVKIIPGYYQEKIESLVSQDLLIKEDDLLRVNEKYLYILDYILEKLLF